VSVVAPRAVVVVSAGVGQPSSTRLLADRLAAAVVLALADTGVEANVTVVEVRDHAQDLVNAVVAGFPATRLRSSIEAVVAADGLIVVTPIFNASYSGLFKLFFDVLEQDSLARRPVLLAATGGTPRHSLVLEHAMRPLFAYLGAATVPTAVFAAADDWGRRETASSALEQRITRAARDLAEAITSRERFVARDPFADPVPFEELLATGSGGSGTADD
jgi:FMN reductase